MNFSTFIIATLIFVFAAVQLYRLYKKRGQGCNDCASSCSVKNEVEQHRK
ncbi:MAG: FeoB-associated Cys-rich membrane protein [Streptococcaceae bacterium]|jgi:hypothetical protein|nr:FeoB-associated Cys-rich membrane protein [Streptococcaceae bacterium]